MQAVLTRTLKHALGKFGERERERGGGGRGGGGGDDVVTILISHVELSGGAKPSPEQIELQLIQSKQDIEHPPSIKEMELQSSSDNMSNGIK